MISTADFHVARKRFGQHFLHDQSVIDKIIAAVDPRPDDAMVEIGPGLGALTGPLLARLNHLHVIEIDRDIVARLREHGPTEKLTIHEGDALKFDFAAVGQNLRIVGNLPYNISTPLLFHLARYSTGVRDLTLMLQREVVERMCAAPGGKDYGRLSVMLQAKFACERLFIVKPGAFRPAPKVDSAIVRCIPLKAHAPHIADQQRFAQVVAAAFAQRRKKLRNALMGMVTEQQLRDLGIDPALRPERLSVAQFCAIANALPAPAK